MVRLGLEALLSGTAQLPDIRLRIPDRVICGRTEESLLSGALYRAAAMTEGLAQRMEQELGYPCTLVFTGGLGLHYGAEHMGATALPVSSGNTKRQVQLLQDFGSDILCCTPSYAMFIGETVRDMGIDPKTLKLRAGLFGAEPWTDNMRREIERLKTSSISPSAGLNALLEERGTAPLATGTRFAELLRRPQVDYQALAPFDPGRPSLPRAVADAVETEIKYAGYIEKQKAQAAEMRRLRGMSLEKLDFSAIAGLRIEAREKLAKIRPQSLGAAANISGVSPADLSVLMLELSRRRRAGAETSARQEESPLSAPSGKEQAEPER